MYRSARFWDWIAKRYSRQPVADEAAYQKKLQVTREYLRPDMQVLEFGCGTGSTAIAHAPYVARIQAIDISQKMLRIAQDKAEAANIDNVGFECASIDEYDQPDESLDAVMGHSILHLLDNREQVIATVHRMLKPGGVFVTSTTCIGESMKLFRLVAPILTFLGLIPLIRFFTVKELEASMTEAGFKIDYNWQPGKNKAVFIVASKAGSA